MMGTELSRSIHTTNVVEIEKPLWLKRGKKHIKRKKTCEVHNGIRNKHEEITEETKCKNYTKLTRIEKKIIYHYRNGEPVQETDFKHSTGIDEISNKNSPDLGKSSDHENSPDLHTSAKITKQRETHNSQRLYPISDQQDGKSVYVISSFDPGYKSPVQVASQPDTNDSGVNRFYSYNCGNTYNCGSKQSFENKIKNDRDNVMPIRENTEQKPILDGQHRQICDTCFKPLHPIDLVSKDQSAALKYDAPSYINDKRKTSLNSLLDERKSSISTSSHTSDTQIKTTMTDAIPDLEMNHELQSMKQLKPNLHNETDGIHNTNLKTMKGEDNTDEESSSNVTYVKELSSSYPDSNLCSDSDPHLTQSSEECYSVSSYNSQRSRADSTTVSKEVAKYNNLSNISIEKTDCETAVMNISNISTDDKKLIKNPIPDTESQHNGNIPEMNDVDTTVDFCDASQSQVRFNKDEEAVKTHTQCDLMNKNLKGSDDDVLNAIILSIHILTKDDMYFGQENHKIVKNIIDLEVDSESKDNPSNNMEMVQTNNNKLLPNSEYPNKTTDAEMHVYHTELDLSETNNAGVEFLIVVVSYVSMILLILKSKDKILLALNSNKENFMEKKGETEADVCVSYDRIKSPDEPAPYPVPMVKSYVFAESNSEIMSDTTDLTDVCIVETINADAIQSQKADNAESCKSELSQSNIPENPELNHTETGTETYQSESATVELENEKTVQNNFVANKEDGNKFEQYEHDESKLKLSESIRRENGTSLRPIISTSHKETDCFLLSNDNSTSVIYKDERSVEVCNYKMSEASNKGHDNGKYNFDLNGKLEEENFAKAATNVYPAPVVKVESKNNTEVTDITNIDREDDLSINLMTGNILGRTECSPSETDISREHIKIGSTERDCEGKQLNFERKLESVLMTDLQSMPSEESVTGPKKKKRPIKERNSSTTANGNAYEMYTFQHKSVIAMNFCQHCHQKKSRQNQNCSECRILNGELGSGKFQYQVMSKDDSGISSLLSSIRSSILSEMESLQSIEITKLSGNRKRNRKKITEKYFKLGTLNRELQNITKRFNDDYLRNADRNIVALPGLQSYFDSLNNGQTPSLQEQMRYEWLRLMSFSNYTGGGSPVHLARNGFYHSGNGETRCFRCNTSHSSWTYSDNVQETHRRISPNCPLVTGGIEINENVSIESGSRANQPLQPPANLGNGSGSAGTGEGGSQSGVYSAARPDLPTSHGGFASNAPQAPTFSFPPASTALGISASPFSFNPPQPAVPRPDRSDFRFPQTSSHVPPNVLSHVGQSAATVTSNAATGFSFGSSVNAPPPPAEFTFAQGTGQQGGGSDITSQLRALTLQQVSQLKHD